MNNENYYTIQGFMVNDLDLSGNELLVYAVIYGFSQDGESSFRGSRNYLSECINGSVATVDRALKGLVEKGLIEKSTVDINGVKLNYYKAVQFDRGCVKMTGGCYQNDRGGAINLTHNNIDNNKRDNNIYNSQKDTAKEIIDLYNDTCTKLPQVRVLTNKRISTINNRLKKYSKDELKQAFLTAECSAFLTGNNDRGWKADFDFIMREDKLANILEGKYSYSKKTGSSIADKWEGVQV